jgi:hypothetical protein
MSIENITPGWSATHPSRDERPTRPGRAGRTADHQDCTQSTTKEAATYILENSRVQIESRTEAMFALIGRPRQGGQPDRASPLNQATLGALAEVAHGD